MLIDDGLIYRAFDPETGRAVSWVTQRVGGGCRPLRAIVSCIILYQAAVDQFAGQTLGAEHRCPFVERWLLVTIVEPRLDH